MWNVLFALLVLLLIAVASVSAQDASRPSAPAAIDENATAIRNLQQEVAALKAAVGEMRSEAAKAQEENEKLRRDLEAMRRNEVAEAVPREETYGGSVPSETRSLVTPTAQTTEQPAPSGSLEKRVGALEELSDLINSKLDDQYQSKAESASKYRLRLSGIVLLNLFSNRGATDNQDIPSFVTGPNQGNGNFGATLRQSEIGLEVFGPTVWGARTSGGLQADFAGGFPDTWNGVNSGVFRLRTASMRLDWDHTSIVAGQDDLFIAPQSPTSFASLAIPAFNYAGNLWAWTPQVRVEHRFDLSDSQRITVQGGVLDNLAGEFPADSYFRAPGPGESSGQPAYAARTSWTKLINGQPLTFGGSGYYSRQDWGNDRYADGWAAITDWQIPFAQHFILSGELYRGRAIGGLNSSYGESVVYEGDPTKQYTAVRPLDTAGGWAQLKVKATPKLEFNGGFGLDSPFASEVRAGASSGFYFLTMNQSALGNVVYRPRSNLLLSAEYRHIRSFDVLNASEDAQQINLVMGILF
jgi:outer membrane murein-binding lipoprotein Lpp